MPKAHVKEREKIDDEDEDDGVRTETQVLCNCMAFTAIIFVVVGELMNENNWWGVVLIGGSISALNIRLTTAGLDAISSAGKHVALPTVVHASHGQAISNEDVRNGDIAIELDRLKDAEVEQRKHRRRERKKEKEKTKAQADEISRRERPRRDREKKEKGKRRKLTRKEPLERCEKKERRSKRKRRVEEIALHTVVEV